MFKAKNRRVHTLSCIMGNAENPHFSIGIHSLLTLPYQVPVVQKVVSTIHCIMLLIFVRLIRWIVIYPVDTAFQRLNNWRLGEVAGNSKVSIGIQGLLILSQYINSERIFWLWILILIQTFQTFEFPAIFPCLPMMQLTACIDLVMVFDAILTE